VKRARLRRAVGVAAVAAAGALVVVAAAVGACLVHARGLVVRDAVAEAPAVSTNAEARALVDAIPGYRRSEEQTYLTLPEWFIVYSADEYGAFVRDRPPSAFPYFGSILQFWRTYCDVYGATRGRYPLNLGYHVATAVIGTSYTLEQALRGAYEHTVGWSTEWSSFDTAEDALARDVARRYGEFVHSVPFYEFRYWTHLARLWTETPWIGPHLVRKLERRAFLTVEYAIEGGYGWLIRKATAAAYGTEDATIRLWVAELPRTLVETDSRIRIVREIDGGSRVIEIPRYEPFREILVRFAHEGVRVIEIAGSDEILVTAIAPRGGETDVEPGQSLFRMPILTRPDRERLAVRVPVATLHVVLPKLERPDVAIEHVYDY
jgi:hypothetical protein